MSGIRQLHFLLIGGVALATASVLPGMARAQGPTSSVPTVPVPTVQVPSGGGIGSPSGAMGGAMSGSMGSPGALSVIVVDVGLLQQEAKVFKSFKSQVESLSQGEQKEFKQIEDDLHAQQADLQRQQGSLTGDQFEAKRRAFEKNVADAQRTADVKKKALDQGAAEAMEKVRRSLAEVVHQVQAEHHATMVLRTDAMLSVDPSLDVTSDVLRRLDEKMASVQVTLPSTAPAPQTASQQKPK